MDLIKKNVHMDRPKCRATTQITLDDDYNIPDSMSDVFKLLIDKGSVKIEDVKVSENHVTVKGRLCFSVLYLSDNGQKNMRCVEGSIAFDEFIHMDGIENGDSVKVKDTIEDLSVSLINSRKLNIKSIVSFIVTAENIADEETAVEVRFDEPIEYRKKSMEIAEIAIEKKDIYRIRETIELPSNLPNIDEILWEDVRIGVIDFKPADQKLTIQGELHLFLLYEAEGEEAKVRWYETRIPFAGSIDCQGCTDEMLLDIQYEIGNSELEIRPDGDGEERSIAIDTVLDLHMKVYREEKIDLLADVYGVTKEITTITDNGNYRSFLMKNNGKCRTGGNLRVKNSGARILQICYSMGTAVIDETQITEDGIEIEGIIDVQVLYITTDDNVPFYSLKGSIPFTYVLDVPGMNAECTYSFHADIEQFAVSMVDSEELEIKAVLNMQVMVFQNRKETIIRDIKVEDLDMEKLGALPGIVGYIAKEGDSLWKIGKKYYVPISQIKETSELTSDEIHAGDKLLIVKTIESI